MRRLDSSVITIEGQENIAICSILRLWFRFLHMKQKIQNYLVKHFRLLDVYQMAGVCDLKESTPPNPIRH